MKYKIVALLLLYAILSSCDPIHSIDITNVSTSDIIIEVKLRDSSMNYIMQNQPRGDSLTIKLGVGETESLYFGIGTWSDEEIRYLANFIQEVKCTTDSSTFKTNSAEYLYNLLESNREGGWWKTLVHLEIE